MAFVDGENGENFMNEIFGLSQFGRSDTWKKQSQTDNKTNDYKRIWHSGSEKPELYKDKITGHELNTYCICVLWYDGWKETMCRVTEDGNFVDISNNESYDHDFFEYWCYTYDIYPVDADSYLVDVSVQE